MADIISNFTYLFNITDTTLYRIINSAVEKAKNILCLKERQINLLCILLNILCIQNISHDWPNVVVRW